MSDSLVIIPTYNEKENVEKIIRSVFALKESFDILIVDDGSPDGTAIIVEQLQHEYKGLFIEKRQGKLGLGTAYIHGFKWALKNEYQFIFEMDADFSHDPKDLIHLHAACSQKKYDLAIGSRYSNGVNIVNWPMSRLLMSYFASKYVKLVTGLPVNDSTAGFICYRRSVLETIDLDHIQFVGYAFQIEMKFKSWKSGFEIIEVPVIFTDRKEGYSKMDTSIFFEAFIGVLQLKLKSLFTTPKQKPNV